MKAISKLLTLLLVLVMVLTLIPNLARAEEAPAETETITAHIPFKVNPLYEGMIRPEDLDIPEIPESDPEQIHLHAGYYSTAEQAAATFRSYMKQRAQTFTLYIQASHSDYNALANEVIATALEHTGNPLEGDYLMWQYGGAEANVTRSYNSATSMYEFTYEFAVVYYTDVGQEQEVTTAVNLLINNLGLRNKTDYEKISAVYDWICQNVTYDFDNLEDTTYTRKFTAYAALIDRTAVCQGYALLFYRLMLELGVDNRLIAGLAASGEAHGWNIVKLGDFYYSVDSTWDAGQTEYSYFLTSTWNFVGHYRFLDYETWEFHEEYPMAAENYDPNTTAVIDPYIYVGMCGEEVYWLLCRDGSLEMAGTGATDDYNTSVKIDPDWVYWNDHITSAYINEGITAIGYRLFENTPNLKQVHLPSTLTSISGKAFSDCPALEQVNFPDSVTSIGEGAFLDCKSLKQARIPDGTQIIGSSVFAGCSSLTEINLPASVTVIGQSAFASCSGLTEINLHEGLVTIGRGAFYNCSGLTSVSFPDSLTTLETYAFGGCTSIKEVRIPDSITTLGTNLFSNCDSLETVYLACRNVPEYAFAYCPSLCNVIFAENVQTIERNAFEDCDSLVSIEIPAHITSLTGFKDCDNLTTVKLSEGLQTIGEDAFDGCKSLENMDLPSTVTSLGAYSFCGCEKLTSIEIPKTMTAIPRHAFKGCTALEEIELHEGLISIESNAFENCTALKEVVFPSTLKTIFDSAFRACHGLTEVTIPENVTNLSGFMDCDGLITIYLNNTGEVGSYAFYDCDSLVNIHFGKNVTSIDSSAFQSCDSLKELTIPATIENVSGFEGCTALETVVLHCPGCIDNHSFSGCKSLKNVTITNATTIGHRSFAYTAIEKLVIPKSVTTIQSYAFYRCKSMKEIWFVGDRPKFESEIFCDVKATAYYPITNDTWDEYGMSNYGGTITWVGYEPECTEHSYDAVVTEPTCKESGYTTYTCSNCGDVYVGDYTDPVDHVYVDGYCKWCGKAQAYAKIISYSTSLGGNIAMNFYVELSEDLVADPDAYIQFSFAGKTVEVPLSEGVPSGTSYRFACPITSKNMTDDITAQVYNADGPVGDPKTMAVDTYCNWIIANTSDQKTINLMKAMLNYGASAQMLFNYRTDDLANAALSAADKTFGKVDASAFAHSRVGEEEGIKPVSYTLLLDSETTVRCYFQLTGTKTIDEFTFTVDGVEVEPVYKDGYYYIEKANIAAHRLDDMHTFTCGNITITYGGLSYVNQVMTYYTSGTTFDMASALYAYSKAAEAYIG